MGFWILTRVFCGKFRKIAEKFRHVWNRKYSRQTTGVQFRHNRPASASDPGRGAASAAPAGPGLRWPRTRGRSAALRWRHLGGLNPTSPNPNPNSRGGSTEPNLLVEVAKSPENGVFAEKVWLRNTADLGLCSVWYKSTVGWTLPPSPGWGYFYRHKSTFFFRKSCLPKARRALGQWGGGLGSPSDLQMDKSLEISRFRMQPRVKIPVKICWKYPEFSLETMPKTVMCCMHFFHGIQKGKYQVPKRNQTLVVKIHSILLSYFITLAFITLAFSTIVCEIMVKLWKIK